MAAIRRNRGNAAYLSHVIFRAGGTDWASFNQQVGPPSFVGGFAVLDGVDDYLGADFAQDYDAAIRNFVATKNHARLKLIDTRLAGLTNPAWR